MGGKNWRWWYKLRIQLLQLPKNVQQKRGINHVIRKPGYLFEINNYSITKRHVNVQNTYAHGQQKWPLRDSETGANKVMIWNHLTWNTNCSLVLPIQKRSVVSTTTPVDWKARNCMHGRGNVCAFMYIRTSQLKRQWKIGQLISGEAKVIYDNQHM